MISTVTFAVGQKIENVTLTGSVTDVRAEKFQGKYFYSIQLYLSLRNDSGRRVILFYPPNLRYLGGDSSVEMIGKLGDATDDSISAGQLSANPGRALSELYGYDPVPDSLKRLETYDPSVSGFYAVFVEPGGYFEFRNSIAVSNGFTPKPSRENPKEIEAIPNFRSLKAKYFLKVTSPQVPDDLLKRLQAKWSPSGHLLLNSEGHFSLISEEIPMVIAK